MYAAGCQSPSQTVITRCNLQRSSIQVPITPITPTSPKRARRVTIRLAAGVPGGNNTVVSTYTEGLMVGYRWYDAHRVQPQFPFGFGLSFSKFTYSDLDIASCISPSPSACRVSFSVHNHGPVTGSHVVQLYLGFPAVAQEPPRVLRRFVKRSIAVGESTEVVFALAVKDFSIWDEQVHGWSLVPGNFGVFVGGSSRDAQLQGIIEVAPIRHG